MNQRLVSERRGAESDITKSEREVLPNLLVLVVCFGSFTLSSLPSQVQGQSKLTEKRRLL